MDKAAKVCEMMGRNALRKANGLPLLDVPAEYAHQTIMAQREYQAICDKHAEEREAIRQQVLADFRAKHGKSLGLSTFTRWAVKGLTQSALLNTWSSGTVCHLALMHLGRTDNCGQPRSPR
jgi:hypothetical protein